MRGVEFLHCELTIEPHFTGYNFLICMDAASSQNGEGNATTRFHFRNCRVGCRVAARRAQQGERMRRIGVLMASAADDPEFQARMVAFQQALALLGWTDGRNLRIDARWARPTRTIFADTPWNSPHLGRRSFWLVLAR